MSPHRCKMRRLARLAAAVAAAPALLWAVVLLIAPTDWARARFVRELEEATGRAVAIESIRLGPLGTMRVRGLAVAEAAAPSDPWLRVAEARLDVHLFRMLTGRCRPGEIDLDGLDLRVRRRLDGSMEFADLLAPRPRGRDPRAGDPDRTRPTVSLRLTGARVVVLDDPSGTRVELDDASGTASWDGRVAEIPRLGGRLNGGGFEFAAHYDRAEPSPSFVVEAMARGVAVRGGLRPLGLLAPVVADVADSLDGRCDLTLTLSGRGRTLAELKPALAGHGSIRIDPIDLSGSRLYAAFDGLRHVPRAGRVGSIESHFAIAKGRIATDDLTLTVARLPTTLVGWTDFDGRIEYEVKADSLDSRLPAEARRFLREMKSDLGDLAHLRIGGTVDAPLISTGPSGDPRALKDVDRTRLREAARVLREKYLR